MSEPEPLPVDGTRDFPRVPGYAWSWLQRSRPVLAEAALQLTGGPPPAGFVDTLRKRFGVDPFIRDIVVSVIAEVAFSGRIPRFRPAGVSWDRGLSWWAAAIAGIPPETFDKGPTDGVQSRLFTVDEQPSARRTAPRASPARTAGGERAALARALRDLLRAAEGDAVPAAAVRQLLASLEHPHAADGGGPQ